MSELDREALSRDQVAQGSARHQRTKPMPASIVYPYSRQTSSGGAVLRRLGW